MNPHAFSNELWRIVLTFIGGAIVAFYVKDIWPIAAVASGFLLFYLFQIWRIFRWMRDGGELTMLPDSDGVWGALYDSLHRRLRTEIRARENIEQLISRAETSITALRDAVFLVDRRGRLEYWNLAAQRLLGFRYPEDHGQSFTNLVRSPALKRYLETADFKMPLVIHSPRDESITIEFSITQFGVGDWLVVVRDITRLQQLEAVRKDFVANVSHELKTPLTVLKGYLETLEDVVDPQQKTLNLALQRMSEQSLRMENLVTDLLLLARLENTEATEEPDGVSLLALKPTLDKTAQGLIQALSKNITLDWQLDESIILRGNRSELESAFGNLISNAIKYTGETDTVIIRGWQDDKGAHLAVTDHGPGIDSKHLPRLTERFYRPDSSRNARTGGTGLGLAIVKHVLARHDGHLTIESKVNKGSSFSCHFPVERIMGHEPASA